YRSGDSEYRLNGVQCRLKDIRNLFLDTGIGSNSYAIIALGMVDDILADKDNSRRRMFEQAAGISKYKNRKKESLRKLKNTEDDLARIEDLLFEITNNLKSLEKQAKRARKYRDLKGQYRDLSLLLTGIRVEKLRIDYEKLREETDKAETAYRQTDQRITQLESRLDEERKKHVDKEQRVGERQRKLNALTGELRNLESERQLLQQRKGFVERQTTQLTEAIARAETEIASYQTQIAGTEQLVTEARGVLDDQQQKRDAAQESLTGVREGHAGLKSKLDESLKVQQEEEKKIFQLEKRRAINGNQIENFRYQVERNQAEMADRRGERENLEALLTELKGKIGSQEQETERLEKQEADRLQAIDEAVTDTEHLQAELNRINRGLDARRNEYKLTKSMIDSLEGFPESIRFLSKDRSWTADPQLLGDLLLVQPEYRAAIENYLEPCLNYYVVANVEEARAAIRLLSDRQKGKANFFVLDALDQADASSNGTAAHSGRSAVEVLTVDEPYKKLVSHLLHGVTISEKDELPAPTDDGTTVLSPDGRYVRRPYSVAGGSLGLFEGKKIGRKKNLEVLDKAIKEAERQ
ncbi:MAG: chromosome segregation protein SMC, partial [Lewinella sp.]